MSSKNDESSGIAIAFGFVIAAAMAFFVVVFTIAAFVCFVLTILCLLSWNKPLYIGKIPFTPEESRPFVKLGIAGALLLPAFFLVVEVFLNVRINWNYFPHFMIGGYMLGSFGFMATLGQQADEPAPSVQEILPQERLPASTQQDTARQSANGFHYASWDDEEHRR